MTQDRQVFLRVARLTQDRAARKPDPGSTRWLDQRQHVGKRTERERRNAGQLDGSRDQSHGLAAERSDGDEQSGVGPGRLQALRDLGTVVGREGQLAGHVPHEAVVLRCQGTDLASVHEGSQAIQRKDHVRVVFGQSVVVMVVSERQAGDCVSTEISRKLGSPWGCAAANGSWTPGR